MKEVKLFEDKIKTLNEQVNNCQNGDFSKINDTLDVISDLEKDFQNIENYSYKNEFQSISDLNDCYLDDKINELLLCAIKFNEKDAVNTIIGMVNDIEYSFDDLAEFIITLDNEEQYNTFKKIFEQISIITQTDKYSLVSQTPDNNLFDIYDQESDKIIDLAEFTDMSKEELLCLLNGLYKDDLSNYLNEYFDCSNELNTHLEDLKNNLPQEKNNKIKEKEEIER